MSSGSDTTVHVELLARSLMRKQEAAAEEELHRVIMSSHRLCRVAVHLRDINANDYTPGFVAIGPLHSREHPRLRPAERLKVAYLNSLISRGHQDRVNHLAVIQNYIRVVAGRVQEARAMYVGEDVADISVDDFIQMMVLDGCFIIEHLVNVATGREEPSLHATPFNPAQLSVDLILAENQMPFFVLVDLITASRLPEFDAGYPPPVLLMKLVLFYLAGEKGRDMRNDALPVADGISHILHLLYEMVTAARTRWEPAPAPVIQDGTATVMEMAQEVTRLVCRIPLLLSVPLLYPILPEDQKWSATHGLEDVPSASDLKLMGVRFKKSRGGGSGSKPAAGIASVLGPVPFAVKLTQHEDMLHLPQLRLGFRTAPLLLNLMAFEQSSSWSSLTYTEVPTVVSAYMSFMAKMVQSAEDSGVLSTVGVVQQDGGADHNSKEEVAGFFRRMGAASEAACGGELLLEKSYLGQLAEKLRERSRRYPLYVMWADVQRNFFTALLTFVAQLVAIVTIVSTILQTYSSFKKK